MAETDQDRIGPTKVGRWLPLSVYLAAFLGLFAVTAFASIWFEHIAVTFVGLSVLLVGTLLLYRAMTTPLRHVSEAMGHEASGLERQAVTASGPRRSGGWPTGSARSRR
jgi:hypothetical protein